MPLPTALPIYDTTGPYTDETVTIDVERGLARPRVEWVKERGGVEEYEGRPIKAVDNGNATGKYLARNFPNTPKPWRAIGDAPVTQYEFARAGIITKEMIYVAERENIGRKKMLDRAEAALADGEQFGGAVPAYRRCWRKRRRRGMSAEPFGPFFWCCCYHEPY